MLAFSFFKNIVTVGGKQDERSQNFLPYVHCDNFKALKVTLCLELSYCRVITTKFDIRNNTFPLDFVKMAYTDGV